MRFESLSRHPDSGIFLLRKRVPKRLRRTIGKREIKISLHTRDPKVARIRHLELLAKVERALSGIDAAIVDGEGGAVPAVFIASSLIVEAWKLAEPGRPYE